jgi:hypothetical protein
MNLFENFFEILSLYLEVRIWIQMKGMIRIRIKVVSWIRLRIRINLKKTSPNVVIMKGRIRIRIRMKVISWIRMHINLQMASQNVGTSMEYEPI